MSIQQLQGSVYGPYPYRTDPEKVSEYATAVGASVRLDRVPASIAGALLFVVAPHLLADPRAGDTTRSVIHGDQTFRWIRDVPLGVELQVTGTVGRVRERNGVYFTAFELAVSDREGPILGGTSTFLMSGGETPPAAGGAERREPEPTIGSTREVTGALDEERSVLGRFAASRADLVRYAGASRDWNPIHWDHAAAVAAGLPGVVVHGLLQSAWVVEAVSELGVSPSSARFRYRRPLVAGVTVDLVGQRRDGGVTLELVDGDGQFLAATID
jgi:acyl dehydratase